MKFHEAPREIGGCLMYNHVYRTHVFNLSTYFFISFPLLAMKELHN